MDRETYTRASQLFEQAVELPAARREGFLAEACAGQPQVLAAALLLLENDRSESADDLFEVPLARVRRTPEPPAEVFPRPFGRYTLLRVIGRGGMGVVYEAEQDQPRQRVALKVIAPHGTSRVALARFRREAEILGRLRHPGIARVFDAGEIETDDGPQPFLAMEFIDGVSIVRHAVERGLDTEARLNLMADVCDAVHHAHQSGVVHRDLKPDNVLVTQRGEVRVLDFGIARASDLSADLDPGGDGMTVEGQAIGTLNYMSPEQLAGEIDAVGPRSDVYGLGIMLFELLAERPPHDLRNRSFLDAARYLETHDPPPLESMATRFRGDPSTIVSKAVAREPSRRYASAAALGADLQRHLRDEPILARPPGAVYRLAKFLRRNRLMVGAASIAFVALSSGTAVATWQAVSARRAQRAAELSEDGARAVARFLIEEILTAETPDVAQGEALTLGQAFERAATKLHVLDAQPEVQASLYHTLGQAFLNLGRYDRAKQSFERALAWRRENLGEDDRASIDSLLGVCSAIKRMPSPEDALPLQRRAVELCLSAHGPTDEQSRTASNNLATLYRTLGRNEEAEATLRSLLEQWDTARGTDELLCYEVMHSLGRVLTTTRRYVEAEQHLLGAAEGKTRLLGELHPSTLTTEIAAGINTYRAERHGEAIEALEAVLPRVIRVYGEDHPTTTTTRETLSNAIVLSNTGLARAEPHLRHAIVLRLADPDTNRDQLAHDYSLLGAVLLSGGKRGEARECLDTALERFRALDPEHPGIAWTRDWIAELERAVPPEGG